MSDAPFSASRLVFKGAKRVELEGCTVPPPAAGQVRIRTSWTLMSTGTEGIVFNRLFDPGTHWANWVKYPFYPGYSALGTIEAVGDGVTAWQPGATVVWRGNHASLQLAGAAKVWPVPAGIEPAEGVWFALAKIAAMGARAAGHENPSWDSARIIDLLFALVRAGRFSLKGLNTHTFKPAQGVEAYALASTRRAETMGILFDWR